MKEENGGGKKKNVTRKMSSAHRRHDRTAPGETPNAGKARRHDNLPPEVTSTPRITTELLAYVLIKNCELWNATENLLAFD